MLTKHDFQIFTKKSLKRRNEPQQFIVNKLRPIRVNKLVHMITFSDHEISLTTLLSIAELA